MKIIEIANKNFAVWNFKAAEKTVKQLLSNADADEKAIEEAVHLLQERIKPYLAFFKEKEAELDKKLKELNASLFDETKKLSNEEKVLKMKSISNATDKKEILEILLSADMTKEIVKTRSISANFEAKMQSSVRPFFPQ